MNRYARTIQYLCVTCAMIAFFFGTAVAQSVTDIIPAIKPPLFTVGVHTVARGMTAPNYAINAPGMPNYLFVVDQPGQLWRVNLQSLGKSVFLDLSSMLVPLGISSLGGYDERGFLGLAFHPDYATNGLFYTYTSEPVDGAADFTFPQVGLDCPSKPADLKPDHQNVIREWHVKNPMSINSRPDKTSRVVLRFDWGNFNHDGGMLAFGPGKMLFISLGDGGGEDDQTCQIGVDGSIRSVMLPGATARLRVWHTARSSASIRFAAPELSRRTASTASRATIPSSARQDSCPRSMPTD